MEDILSRFKLSLQDCRGQAFDGASDVMGKTSGVATKLLVEQPKALVTHCQDNSLSLAVKHLTSCCKKLCVIMSTASEICLRVKYSPERENILGRMQESVESNFDPDNNKFSTLEKLCPTRWTVPASCFQKITTAI